MPNSKDTTQDKIQILHLSDLHFGMKGQKPLWPNLKQIFHEDLRRLHRKAGAWDIVIFSGDLTQTGSAQEYEELKKELYDLWRLFRSLGFNPEFFPIPGNHDLSRPSAFKPESIALNDWESNLALRNHFWSSSDNEYRKYIDEVFSNFTNWQKSLQQSEIPLTKNKIGLLPGDGSFSKQKGSLRIGLVGLNSAWLQLDGKDYEGKLDVSVNQLHAVTDDVPSRWNKENDFNLIITHHPIGWLNASSQLEWNSEIFVNGWFDAHLFGHMHEPIALNSSINGSRVRVSIQAPSIFGLETYGNDKVERRHGYSLLTFRKNERKLQIWPRHAHRMSSGERQFIVSPDFRADEDSEFTTVQLDPKASVTIAPNEPRTENESLAIDISIAPKSLSVLKKESVSTSSHGAIRTIQRESLLRELNSGRPAWVVSDWGLGTSEFLETVAKKMSPTVKLYALDIDQYKSLENLLSGVLLQFGYSFETLIQQLDKEGPCLLVLEDASITESDRKWESELEHLAITSKNFAKNVSVVITSRIKPSSIALTIVQLTVLDELETALYIQNHSLASEKFGLPDTISALHRHTDGIPVRLDTALQYVEVVGLRELSSINSDVYGKQAGVYDASPALQATVNDLKGDPNGERTFELLKALAMFPAGERFNSVKRFNGSDGFYPQNAQRLIDAALVDKVEANSIEQGNIYETARALLVRRSVREYLYSVLSQVELESLNKKALALYFGPEWQLGNIKTPASLRFEAPNQAAWVLTNASFMVMRVIKDARETNDSKKMTEAINLATSFCDSLIDGDHYRSAYLLLEDAMPVITSGLEELKEIPSLRLIKLQWAKAARMMGKTEQSLEITLDNLSKPSKKHEQSILLNLALCHEKLGNQAEALDAARRCWNIDATTNTALHAKVIIAENDFAVEDSEKRLAMLERAARKKDAKVVANNIALQRAERETDPIEAARLAQVVAQSVRGTDDYYNAYRATILVAAGQIAEGKIIDKSTLSSLIKAYHYLYNQRFDGLFNRCHEVLWNAFEQIDQPDNLLKLFRHSSFIWRLRRKTSLELNYLRKLNDRFSRSIEAGISGIVSTEMGYLLVRVLNSASELRSNPDIDA